MSAQTKSVPLWRAQLLGIVLALLAALAGAFMSTSDTNVMHNILVSDNRIASTMVYLTLGGWVGTISFFVYNLVFGKILDKSYTGLHGMPPRAHLLAITAGLTGALGTAFSLYVAGDGDPSVLIALSNFVLVYLTIYDGSKKLQQSGNAKPLIWGIVASLIVVVGSALAIVDTKPESVQFDFAKMGKLLLYMLVLSASLMSLSRIFADKAIKDQKVSPVNFTFWRFLWLGIVGTFAAITVVYLCGVSNEYWSLLKTTTWKAVPWVAITMFFAYGVNVFFALAQEHIEVSTVSILVATQAILAVPFTMAAVILWPDKFDAPDNSSVLWVYRAVGVLLIFIGLTIALRLKNNKR